ncbi:ferredoxin-NADP reductase/predicted pyridoxine 5'-phosphate oxidase superfamily flavin-nucleotide-binding protein [Phyllobacterium ifriqiyense]|uniref:Ferredoxin-NADP reductase/predicted pyridoxine 5'-phosphate oxidase superfamily flavin-nucleotide-binding protein n=1 Tax=Phyllobacterium ifriqiyense TaxID=314238 RepID=A0ABU0S448_9HYPH|nr:pyridoxamine 5'-phosphate oxidase family protein [Phyllobacterium ifriqiyense]MDQ0995514.1 ferredoxin-NADP reductase/predicted pyridoxine 5'-phosphate oxidase superfamily flavin-nucleotide-binding protein [Phyllobacterium ifriqiyense]
MSVNGQVVYELAVSPWHEGEKKLQNAVGVLDKMEDIGRRFIRDRLIEQHRNFYPQLPFVVVGAVDGNGDPWATFLAGKPGFMSATNEHSLKIAALRDPGDPAVFGMNEGDSIGILGIELHTRRRNRLNGIVANCTDAQIDLQVVHSFGNCPRYIQYRDYEFVRDPAVEFHTTPEVLGGLDEEARDLILKADTFFVASYAQVEGNRQVDVSHRGGKPGFVRIGPDGLLTIPDFNGNLFFNTLGNIALNGRAGLVFASFDTGEVLQMSGRAEIILDSPEIAAFQGAERLWNFRPERIVRRREALPLRWATRRNGESPFSTMTGDWHQAANRQRATELAKAWRPFRVDRIVDESSVIKSIYLSPNDGAGLIPHAAGQHLPVRISIDKESAPLIRTYTLSVAPSDGVYRISVKKDGRISGVLHQLKVGSIIEVRTPAGGFTIDPLEPRPVVLLAAGIGITPMLAMLRHLVYEGRRKQRMRKTWMIYSARTKAEQGFGAELADLVFEANGAVRLVKVLSATEDATHGVDFDEAGRINIELIKKVLPFDDFDFYLCGPSAFMQDTYSALRSLNVPDKRIFAESFGPGSISRQADADRLDGNESLALSTVAVPVIFTESAKETRWLPESGTLLELAEARGLTPEFSCRSGTCGTCVTKLVKGSVAYKKPPEAAIGDGEVLICSAYPASVGNEGAGGLQIAL